MPAIFVADGDGHALQVAQSIEAGDVDGDQPANLRQVHGAERLDAADPAEPVMNIVAAELIVAQLVRALKQAEGRGRYHGLPEALPAAGRAVASLRALGEVELDQLGVALAKARADTSQARAKLDRINHILEQRSQVKDNEGFTIPDPVVTDALSSPVITKLRQQFLDDQNKEVEWAAHYGAQHAAVKNLRAEMGALQNSIWDEISRIAESYKSELQIAKSQEEAIDKRMLDVFQKSGATRQAQVRLRELETGANTYRGIYETFLSRFTQSVQQQSFPSTEARVVTDASVPQKPSSPRVGITIAFAALCGLGLGVMSAIGREQLMYRSIHARDQLEKLLGTHCLAVLPAISKPSDKFRGLRGRDATAFYRISEASPFSATAEALRSDAKLVDGLRKLGLDPGALFVLACRAERPRRRDLGEVHAEIRGATDADADDGRRADTAAAFDDAVDDETFDRFDAVGGDQHL